MLIGWPLTNARHPVSQQLLYGVDSLFRAFERENPDIRIELIPAQWGSGATGFMPKSRALLLSNSVDILEVCTTYDFANQGAIECLEPWIRSDPDFDSSAYLPGMLNRWPTYIWKEHGYGRYCLPLYSGVRLTGYDRELFRHFGVDTLSTFPTPQEILDKAARLTGKDPVTGKQVYGIFFQGRMKLFLFLNALTAFNGKWGEFGPNGLPYFTLLTPENQEAVEWLLQLSRYAPASLMSVSNEYEAIWGTVNNYTAIRLQSSTESLFFSEFIPGARQKDGSFRFRYAQLFHDTAGNGGFAFGSGLSLASSSTHKKEAWRLIKWLSMNPVSQRYLAHNLNVYPVIRRTYEEDSLFSVNENFRTAIRELSLPGSVHPWQNNVGILENGLDKALMRARESGFDSLAIRQSARLFLETLQTESEKMVAYENRYSPDKMISFRLSRFAFPFFITLLSGLLLLLILGRKQIRRHGIWYLFLLPSLMGVIVFLAYPIAESFRLSLFRSNGFMEMFTGLENYRKVITDPNFHLTLYNTFYIGLSSLTLGIPLGFILASLINSQKKVQAAFKTLYFLPMVTSTIASAIIFKYLFEPDFGIVNTFLIWLGVPTEGLLWLNSPETSKFVVILFSLWQGTGYTVLICLSGLQSIPDYLYEAAAIDGCSALQKWRHITLPNMRPTFIFLIMTGCIGALKRFEDVFTLGGMQGAPARSLQTSVGYIFEQAFGVFNFGAASAAAYLLFILVLLITILNYRFMLRKEM